MKDFTNLPMVGPWREHQERCWALGRNWLGLLKSTGALALPLFEFGKIAALNLPGFCGDLAKDREKPPTFLVCARQYLGYLDQCWQRVLNSEDYSRRSGEFVERWMDFQRSLDSVWSACLEHTPFATEAQMRDLAEQVRSLREELEKCNPRQAEAPQPCNPRQAETPEPENPTESTREE